MGDGDVVVVHVVRDAYLARYSPYSNALHRRGGGAGAAAPRSLHGCVCFGLGLYIVIVIAIAAIAIAIAIAIDRFIDRLMVMDG